MSDNIDALRIEIIYDDKATKGLEGLISTLERLKSFSGADSGIKDLSQSVEQATSGMSTMKEALKGASEASSETKSSLKDIKGGFSDVSAEAEKVSPAFKKANKGVTGLFRAMKRVAVYRALRAVLKHITQAVGEGVRNVYQYSKAVGGDLANSFDKVSSSMAQFKNSIGGALAPLLQTLAPVIDTIVQKLITFMNVLSQLFAKLAGKSTWLKATASTKAFGASAVSAGKAVKELKASLLGIDEINLMQGADVSGGGGGGVDMSPEQMFEEVEISPAFDKLKLTLKDIKWYAGAIGAGFAAWKIGGFLKSITDCKIGLKEIAGMTFTVVGTVVFAKGFYDAIENELNSKNLTEMVAGGGLAAGGLFLLNFNAGMVGLGTAGLGIALAGMNDQVENGVNKMNTIAKTGGLAVLGTVAGFFLLGGPIGAVIGGGLGVIAGSVDTLWNQIAEDWDFWSGYIKNSTKETWGDIEKVSEGSSADVDSIFALFAGSILRKLKKWKKSWEKSWEEIKAVPKEMGKDIKKSLDTIGGHYKITSEDISFWTDKAIASWERFLEKLRGVKERVKDFFSFTGSKENITVSGGGISLPAFADGGQVTTGQLFVAREAGPELVGTMGGKSTVANNMQIVDGIKEGVKSANTEQNALLREQNNLLRALLDKDSSVRAVISTSNVIDGLARKNVRDGRTMVPVGG